MPKKTIDDEHLMDEMDEDRSLEFDQGDELDFAGEDDLLDEESEDDEIAPSVLYKGASRPKTDDDWRQLLLDSGKEGKRENIPEYRLTDAYKEGDLISHNDFGLGVVSKVITERKIEVIFEGDKKLMAMSTERPS